MFRIHFKLPKKIRNMTVPQFEDGAAEITCSIELNDTFDKDLQNYLIANFNCQASYPTDNFINLDDIKGSNEKLISDKLGYLKFNQEQTINFLKAILQAPVRVTGSPSDPLNYMLAPNEIQLGDHWISVTSMGSIVAFDNAIESDNSADEQKIIPIINNIYKIIPCLVDLCRIGTNFSNIDRLIDCKNELVDAIDDRKRLIILIHNLVDNIIFAQNGRITSGSTSTKTRSLYQLLEHLNDNSKVVDKDDYLKTIKNICSQKRHFWHFWQEPHSVHEFEALASELKLTDSFSPSNKKNAH